MKQTKKNDDLIKIENHSKSSVFENLIHIFCLIFPVVFTFLGFFLSDWIWTVLFKQENLPTEVVKFLISIAFFAVSSLIVFVTTRNTKYMIKLRVS
ncbi:MAG: hypothetical protein J6C25_10235 [Treponema sp.]|nr:hypothetical protein [Treponema sp.]MBR2106623.1 hypothetical protein [Treponema sp.]